MEGKMKVRLLSTNEVIEIQHEDFDDKLHSQDLAVQTPAVVVDDKSEDRALADFKDAEAKRSSRIRELMIHFEEDELWAQRHIKLGSTVAIARADGAARAAKKAPDIDGRLTVGSDYDSLGWKVARISEGLSAPPRPP